MYINIDKIETVKAYNASLSWYTTWFPEKKSLFFYQNEGFYRRGFRGRWYPTSLSNDEYFDEKTKKVMDKPSVEIRFSSKKTESFHFDTYQEAQDFLGKITSKMANAIKT